MRCLSLRYTSPTAYPTVLVALPCVTAMHRSPPSAPVSWSSVSRALLLIFVRVIAAEIPIHDNGVLSALSAGAARVEDGQKVLFRVGTEACLSPRASVMRKTVCATCTRGSSNGVRRRAAHCSPTPLTTRYASLMPWAVHTPATRRRQATSATPLKLVRATAWPSRMQQTCTYVARAFLRGTRRALSQCRSMLYCTPVYVWDRRTMCTKYMYYVCCAIPACGRLGARTASLRLAAFRGFFSLSLHPARGRPRSSPLRRVWCVHAARGAAGARRGRFYLTSPLTIL